MRIIAENELELSDMVYKKTQYQKEKVEREVEESRLKVEEERRE
jgi:hypothetical protein